VALTQALLPALRSARGQVVFINSGAGINVSPGLAAYSASKFALRAFADSLRADEPLLRVTSIHPGRVDTEMQRDLVAYEGGDYDPSRFLSAETVARITAEAINAPDDAHVHEVIVRPRPRRQDPELIEPSSRSLSRWGSRRRRWRCGRGRNGWRSRCRSPPSSSARIPG
jgi:NADP-dependent 3-hydroxy acid dehydrogenase YdfG